MQKIMRRLGMILVLSVFTLGNGCEYKEIGTLFIPDLSYSANISNTYLEVLTLTSMESSTGITTSLVLAPAFSPSTYNYNVTIEPLVTSVAVVAVAEDERSTVAINTQTCTSRSIDVGGNSATIVIEVTAPDGVTVKTYEVNITRSVGLEESRLLNFEFYDEDNNAILLSPQFDPDTSSYKLHVAWNSYYVKFKPTAISTLATIKVDGKTVLSGEKDIVILSSIGIGDSKATQVVTVTSTASNGDVSTYTFEVSRLSQPVVTSNNSYLSSIKVVMGALNSERQVYRDTDDNFHADNTSPFDKDVFSYSCVVFGFTTVRAVITPADPAVSQLTVNGVDRTGSITSGKLTEDVTWGAGEYTVKTLAIHVVSKDGTTSKDYSLKIRLLNIYEFYYGLYGPVGRANKASWGSPGTPKWSKTFNGSISGTMVWSLDWVQMLSTVRNQMVYTDYNNGDWDMPFVGDNGGFKLNGTMSVIVNTSGTQTEGPQTGDITMKTPEGDAVAIQHLHLHIVSKDAQSRDATSYTTVDYMNQTGVILYYDSNPAKPNLGSAYWDPAVPWTGNDFWHP